MSLISKTIRFACAATIMLGFSAVQAQAARNNYPAWSAGNAPPTAATGQPAPGSSNASQLPGAALGYATSQARNALAIWSDAPDWLKRVEWDAEYGGQNGMEYNILTTQPLYQSADFADTLFWQASFEHYKLFDIGRNTVNAGIGYRRLLMDNQVLLGVNNFYDYELGHDHARSSIGAEAKWGPLDAYANYYYRLSDAQMVDGGLERVDNGFDVSLGTFVPFLPWAKVYGRYYEWQQTKASDIHSGEFSTELALTPDFTLVGGTRGGEDDDRRENYVMLEFRFGGADRPTMVSDLYSTQPFLPRDLKDETLSKVRRENRIIVERVGGSGAVIVARGH